jgi:hypothetical protein
MSDPFEPIDIVYTWVDDTWPGYADTLARHAGTSHDRNPNRTRDNLDLLKYSMRSLAHCPWVRRVYLVTAAPQVPRWLNPNAEGLSIVHHDAILEPRFLPTFNSFAIFSALYRLEGLSDRFVYVEDDMLFGRPVTLDDFCDADGRMRLFPRLRHAPPPAVTDRADLSPWNRSLAYSNALLDAAFGPTRRREINHVPLLVDKALWAEMCERWAADFERTRASRFRGQHNVVPEYLYPWFLYHTGRGALMPLTRTLADSAYVPLENTPFISALTLWRAQVQGPKFISLNDGFGAHPRRRVEQTARRYLERAFPVRSRFEL